MSPQPRVDSDHTMTSPCPDPPSRPSRETLTRLIDLVAWAKTCMLITAATRPGSPERAAELQKLREAIIEPRALVDKVLSNSQALPQALLVDLRTSEMSIQKLEAGAVLRTSSAHNTTPKNTPEGVA